MNKNTKTQNSDNRIYKIFEMKDELESALKNLAKVKQQQNKLIDILSKDKYQKDFVEFVSGLKESNKNLWEKETILKSKLDKCNQVITLYENESTRELVTKIITDTLSALGVE